LIEKKREWDQTKASQAPGWLVPAGVGVGALALLREGAKLIPCVVSRGGFCPA
jgi:hypothetical protein